MILTGKIKVLSYREKTFKNPAGQEITFNEITFCDDEGNKFSGSVPKVSVEDIALDIKSPSSESIEGLAQIQLSKATTTGGRTYVKLQVISFQV